MDGRQTWSQALARAWPLMAGLALVAALIGPDPRTAGVFLGAFAFTWWLVPYVALVAQRFGAIALPGGRAVNKQIRPLLGGVAVYLSLAVALATLAIGGDSKALGLGLGMTLMVFLGGADDVHHVRPRIKILVQVAAALCLWFGGFRLPAIAVPELYSLPLGMAELPVMIFWVVLVTNALNLIDGMDGVASSVTFLAALAFYRLGAMPIVTLVLAGATLGFLRHNYPPARIFLGDSGSLVLGFTLAALTFELPVRNNLPLALAILAYPLGDVFLAMLRRFVRGKPLFAGDRGHVHHKIYGYLQSNGWTLAVVVVFSGVLMALAIRSPGRRTLTLIFLAWALVAVLLVWAGQFRLKKIFGSRRPLRFLYVVREYVDGALKLAHTREEVNLALLHLAEALRLSRIEVRGTHVTGPPAAGQEPVEHVVALKEGTARWAAAPLYDSESLEEERRTVVTDMVRHAASRLWALKAVPAGDAVVTLKTRARPAAGPGLARREAR